MAQDIGVKSIPELRQFGSNLNQASTALNTLFQQLNGQMHRACDTWNDDSARVFMAEFEQSKTQIDKIAQQMQQFSSFIQKKCDRLEEANNVRF